MRNVTTIHLSGDAKVESYWNDVIDSGIINVTHVAPKGQPPANFFSLHVRRDRPGLANVIDSIIKGLASLRQRLLVDCESCQGTGSEEVEETNMMTGEPELAFYPCPACLGEGKVAPSESTAA